MHLIQIHNFLVFFLENQKIIRRLHKWLDVYIKSIYILSKLTVTECLTVMHKEKKNHMEDCFVRPLKNNYYFLANKCAIIPFRIVTA